jgi:hypothetical protein
MPKYEVEYLVTEIHTAVIEADCFDDVSDKFWDNFHEHNLEFERTISEEINAITQLTELEED